jgi:PmbA protein
MNFEELSEKIIKKTISAGATDCDVVLAKGESKSISYRLGKIEDIDKSDGRTFGIRALIGNQQAFISSSDPDNENIEKLVHKVVQMAHLAPEDDTACLGDSSYFESNFESLDLCQNNETSTEDLIEMAKECEDEALSQSGITNSEGSGASYGYSEFFLATSNGFNGGYKSSSNSISCSVIAGEGQSMERDYDYAVAKHIEDLSSPKEVGLSSAQKALRRMNPRKIKSCQIPVVFDKRISNKIIGYVAGAVSGSAIARGTSFLKDSLGQQIFNKDISIIDDPKIIRGLGSRPFDGEGIKTNQKEIVSNGILNTWLLNTSTAKKLNLKSTGHASRSIGSPPGISTSNLYMVNGIYSYNDLIDSIKSGFYATELIGMGVNLVTGDYSMGASGMWIENGEIKYAVSEVTIASNLKEMFLNLSAANDLEFKSSANAPTIKIENMTLAGK